MQKCVILTFSQGRFRQTRRNSSAGLSRARGGWHTKGHQRQAELTKVISVKRLTCHCFCSCSSEHMCGRAPSSPLSGWNLNPAQIQVLTAPLFIPAVVRSVLLPFRTTDENQPNAKHRARVYQLKKKKIHTSVSQISEEIIPKSSQESLPCSCPSSSQIKSPLFI